MIRYNLSVTQMELTLRYYGEPVLRERAALVETFDDELREFAAAMVATMRRERGIGLAAPQVGVGKRVIIARSAVLLSLIRKLPPSCCP